MRLAVLLMVAACGGSAPKPGAPSACPKTTKIDLASKSLGDAKLRCVAADMRNTPAQVADAVIALDWKAGRANTKARLARIPLEAADWYGLADVVADKDPGVALELYSLAAERASTSDVRIAINARELRIAKAMAGQDPDSSTEVERARGRLVANASAGSFEKLQVLQVLIDEKEQPAVQQLCSDMTDPSAVWPCIENDPAGLKGHLPQVLALTELSYKDVPRLRKLAGGEIVTRGLQCHASDARRFIETANEGRDFSREQVLLYYRLRNGAPRDEARCLLQNAALGCLQLVAANKACPALSAFADYFRLLESRDQEDLLDGVFFMKGMFYRLRVLESNTREAEGVLFHLHLLLADVLAMKLRPRQTNRLPQFHVDRALEFFKASPEPGLRFSDLLSDEVIGTVCGDPDARCKQTCAGGYMSCERDCKALTRSIASMCPTP